MKRIVVLAVLLALGAVSVSLRAFQRGGGPAAQMTVDVEEIRDNLFVLRGGGGSTAVFVRTDGVTVVDTKNPGWGQPILAKIKELTDKPVTTIVNTHTHGDHVSGNVEFPATVDVVTHANTRANMEQMVGASGFVRTGPSRNIFVENDGRGTPTRVFSDYMALGDGADQIDLHYFGRGHTNGDAWVVFPALRVVHSGDIFPGRQVPILDSNNGGSGADMPRTLSKAHAMLTGVVDIIIAGHGPVMTLDDLQEWVEFNQDFLDAMREAKSAGRTASEAAAEWTMPTKYQGYGTPQAMRLQANIELIYQELP